MAKVFISHSSIDKQIASQLHADLEQLGHASWLDVYEIKVGDGVTSKIQAGIGSADFVVVLLSNASVKSKWVEREWQAKFGDEVASGRSIILPVRLDNCDIPALLKDKHFADASKSYAVAFKKLCEVLDKFPRIAIESAGVLNQQPSLPDTSEAVRLLSLLGDEKVALATSVPQVLQLARAVSDAALTEYCQVQLQGIQDREYSVDDLPIWAEARAMKAHVSLDGPLNPSYIGWNGNTGAIWQYIENSNRFKWFRLIIPDPIHWIEGHAARAKPDLILSGSLRAGDIDKSSKNPEFKYTTYMHWDVHIDVCTRIRQDLVRLVSAYA